MTPQDNPFAMLKWQIDAGADEAIGDTPIDRFSAPASAGQASAGQSPADQAPARPAAPQTPAPRPPVSTRPTPGSSAAGAFSGPAEAGHDRAAACTTLAEIHEALENFDGCSLKLTATNTVFIDGNPRARLLLIGEAPGAEEDRQGLPFVGAAGQLLDRMLDAIGLDRQQALITNTVFWRPPGNRNPSSVETAACLPFVERVIEIADPAAIVLLGAAAARALLGRTEGIMKLRGRWTSIQTPRMSHPVPALPIFHPAFLLRSPAQKRATWKDLLELRRKLEELSQDGAADG